MQVQKNALQLYLLTCGFREKERNCISIWNQAKQPKILFWCFNEMSFELASDTKSLLLSLEEVERNKIDEGIVGDVWLCAEGLHESAPPVAVDRRSSGCQFSGSDFFHPAAEVEVHPGSKLERGLSQVNVVASKHCWWTSVAISASRKVYEKWVRLNETLILPSVVDHWKPFLDLC